MIADASGDTSFSSALETALLDDLRATSVQGINSYINLAVRDADRTLIGGLAASTSYGWLRVNMLWISTGHRRIGLGRQLMQKAIQRSLENGCHSAWLETSNRDARIFYENLGFGIFAELANGKGAVPETHRRWFLRRKLTASVTAENP